MGNLIPQLPTGSALVIFVICLVIGCFVIIRYCLDQFDKPIAGPDNKMPWDFVGHIVSPRGSNISPALSYIAALFFSFSSSSSWSGRGTSLSSSVRSAQP